MSVTDPIADLLTRVRNAQRALHKDVTLRTSKVKEAIASILKEEGYIEGFSVADKELCITLRYYKGKPVINGLRRVSTPGRRVYVAAEEIPKVQNGLGICIVSTSKGILEGQAAKDVARNVGGELMCEVW